MADQQLMESCINQCLECTDVASRCVDGCLGSEQTSSMEACVRLCLDSTDITAALTL